MRYEAKSPPGGYKKHWMENSSQNHYLSSCYNRGESARDPRAHNKGVFRSSCIQREANKMLMNSGSEMHSLILRENCNNTLQPLYPMSLVNNSFEKHFIAKTVDFKGRPRPENENPPGTRRTQKSYLPYERTRSDFRRSLQGNNTSSAREKLQASAAPSWWPKVQNSITKLDSKSGVTTQRGATFASFAQKPRQRTPPGYLVSARSGMPLPLPNYVD